MDFRKLAGEAKGAIDKRGGTDALKADADELKKIAKGEGSLTGRAKAAAAALKDPGEKGADAKPGHKEQPGGEMHSAKDAGDPRDTPRKGGPPREC